jgi:hypothetical protein
MQMSCLWLYGDNKVMCVFEKLNGGKAEPVLKEVNIT